MQVTRMSYATGQVRTFDLPITEEQLRRWLEDGVKIQDAMPELTPEQREFLLTGITKEEWDLIFPPEQS